MPSSTEVLLRSQRRTTITIWDNEPLLQDQSYLFYPACGIDWQPLQQFADLNIFSCFIYCDHERHINTIFDGLPNGFQVLDPVEIGPGRKGNNLRPWSDYFPNDHQTGFVVRAKILLPSQKIIVLYYFGTEAVKTSKILFSAMGSPKCVVLADNGVPIPMGGDSALYNAYPRMRRPQFLYVRDYTHEWPEYEVVVDETDPHPDGPNMVLYRRPLWVPPLRNGV